MLCHFPLFAIGPLRVKKWFSVGEPVDQVKRPFWLVIWYHMAGISHEKLCEVTKGLGVARQLRPDIPEITNIKEEENNILSRAIRLVAGIAKVNSAKFSGETPSFSNES